MITLPDDTDTAHVVHAGTALDDRGRLVASGGRVLTVVARGDDLAAAREAAYTMVSASTSPAGSTATTSRSSGADGPCDRQPVDRPPVTPPRGVDPSNGEP